jgi:hypothetical protein
MTISSESVFNKDLRQEQRNNNKLMEIKFRFEENKLN